jgi:hypothetical protein
MREKAPERWAAIAVAASAGIALLVLAARGIFLRWYADDYWPGIALTLHGVWGSQVWWYHTISGRFASELILTTLVLLGPAVTPMVIATAIAVFVAGLVRALGWPLGLAAAYAVLLGTPDVMQSVLWQTGIVTYALPIAVFAWWLGTTRGRSEWRWWDVVVPVISGGFSETNLLSQLAACAVAVALWRRKPHVAGLCASLAALAYMMSSPGNLVRHSNYPPVAPPRILLPQAAGLTAMFFIHAVTRWGMPLLFVFFTAALFAPRGTPKLALGAALWAVATAAAAQTLAYAALSTPLPSRAEIVLYAPIVATAMALGSMTFRSWDAAWLRGALTAAAAVTCIAPLSGAVWIADSIGPARRFARSWDQFDRACRQARGRDLVVRGVPTAIGTYPFVLHDSTAQFNRHMAIYYGLRSLASEPAAASPPGAVHAVLENEPFR